MLMIMIMSEANQVLYTNLLLLGFNPVAMEAKHQTEFNKDMFLKPNKKAFEVVSYFLFSKLDAAVCKERFRNCWPIFDKKQEQEFRKTCCNWIKDISIEYSEARFPRIIPSMFLSPGGDKFIGLYLSFSRYVLQKVVVRDFDDTYLFCSNMPSLSEDYANITKIILNVLTNKAIQNFLRILQVTEDLHKIWYNYSKSMISVSRCIKKKINEKKEMLIQKEILLRGNSLEDFKTLNETPSEQNINSQQERMHKICNVWTNIEEFQDKERKYWEVLSSVVDVNSHYMVLGGNMMDFTIPSIFLQQCKDNLLQKGLTKFYKNGKLDITSVLQMWNVYLEFQHHILVKAEPPDAKLLLEILKGHAEDHTINLGIVQNLSSNLNIELLPSIKFSVSGLSVVFDTLCKDTKINIQDRTFELCSSVPFHGHSTSGVPRRKEYVRSPLLKDPFGNIKRKSTDGKEMRITEVVHLEHIGKKQRTKVTRLSDNVTPAEQFPLKPCCHEGSCDCPQKEGCNKSEVNEKVNIASLPPCTNKCSINETSTVYAANSSDNFRDRTAVSENVKEKFAEMIAGSVINDTGQDGLNSLLCESEDSLTPDLYEQAAFVSRNRLTRTPPSQINGKQNMVEDILSQNDLHCLEQSETNPSRILNLSVAEMDEFFEIICPSNKKEISNPVTSSSILQNSLCCFEEDLLTNVTFPLVSPSNIMNQQNTPSNPSNKISCKTEDSTLHSECNKENYLPDLLKEYFDIVDKETCEDHNETFLSNSDDENFLLTLF